jgi:hypothetical protein
MYVWARLTVAVAHAGILTRCFLTGVVPRGQVRQGGQGCAATGAKQSPPAAYDSHIVSTAPFIIAHLSYYCAQLCRLKGAEIRQTSCCVVPRLTTWQTGSQCIAQQLQPARLPNQSNCPQQPA